MDWMGQLGGLLQQYAGGRPQRPEEDFDRVSGAVPRGDLADGIAESFRSRETPPFPQMLGQLFRNSDSPGKAGVLNQLLAAAGPAVLGNMLGGGRTQVTPEEAERIPAERVEEMAARAESENPSVVDRVSDLYAANPGLFRTLGAAALTVVMARLAQKQYR